MANINELLEKYFKAETSLVEENEIKTYFKSADVEPKFEIYRELFLSFEEELCLEMPKSIKQKELTPPKKFKHFWFGGMSLSGVAASFVLGFWFFCVDAYSDYAVIKGEIIKDEYLVQQLANLKLSKVNKTLNNAFQSVHQVTVVKENMKSINLIKKTRKKISEIKETVNRKNN